MLHEQLQEIGSQQILGQEEIVSLIPEAILAKGREALAVEQARWPEGFYATNHLAVESSDEHVVNLYRDEDLPKAVKEMASRNNQLSIGDIQHLGGGILVRDAYHIRKLEPGDTYQLIDEEEGVERVHAGNDGTHGSPNIAPKFLLGF